jgi:hypothetical protein
MCDTSRQRRSTVETRHGHRERHKPAPSGHKRQHQAIFTIINEVIGPGSKTPA